MLILFADNFFSLFFSYAQNNFGRWRSKRKRWWNWTWKREVTKSVRETSTHADILSVFFRSLFVFFIKNKKNKIIFFDRERKIESENLIFRKQVREAASKLSTMWCDAEFVEPDRQLDHFAYLINELTSFYLRQSHDEGPQSIQSTTIHHHRIYKSANGSRD